MIASQAASAPVGTQRAGSCRSCGAHLTTTFVDLGNSPPSNAYVRRTDLYAPETYFPLHAYVCGACFLVQVEAFQTPAQIFGDYAYFSSFSATWLSHGERFAEAICRSERLQRGDTVLEIASNDGYLLQRFAERGLRVVGVEPAHNVAQVAVRNGIPTVVEFFGTACARRLRAENIVPRLLVANNVLAHVPDLHDFVAGIALMLEAGALATVEFPHLLRLIDSCQFDTIYHEHFSYLSLVALEPVLARHGLAVSDVEELSTHGGSLRVHIRPTGSARVSDRVWALRALECEFGLGDLRTYTAFSARVVRAKRDVLEFLLGAQAAGASVAAYGAPAKGNTLLNYCGVRSDLIAFAVDRNPHKQGLFLPGSHIPILAPDAILEQRPEYVVILPWNIAAEVMEQMQAIRSWGGRFVTAVPHIVVHP